jgi:hypothetical protein
MKNNIHIIALSSILITAIGVVSLTVTHNTKWWFASTLIIVLGGLVTGWSIGNLMSDKR